MRDLYSSTRKRTCVRHQRGRHGRAVLRWTTFRSRQGSPAVYVRHVRTKLCELLDEDLRFLLHCTESSTRLSEGEGSRNQHCNQKDESSRQTRPPQYSRADRPDRHSTVPPPVLAYSLAVCKIHRTVVLPFVLYAC